ncbi:hypothetical protein C3L33_07255, partial [Rhododendron williamsianum]
MGRPPEHFMGYVHLYSIRVLDIMSEQDGCNSNGHVEVTAPAPKKDEVLIKVEAASLNPADWKLQKGMLRPILPSKFPFIPVSDVAGEVVEVGFGVKKFKPGDKVVAYLGLSLVKEGKLKTVIDSKHPLSEAEEAWVKSIDGHATGKIIDRCNPNGVTYALPVHGLCEAWEIEEAFRLKEEISEKGC